MTYTYLVDGFYLWTGNPERMDAAGMELVEVDDLTDRVYARLDAKSAQANKRPASRCNPTPVKNSKGMIIRPATFPCGSVCRQKKNCGLSATERKRVQSRLKGSDDREVKLAMVRAERAKRQGKSGTSAVYEATKDALGKQGQKRNEKRKARGARSSVVRPASGPEAPESPQPKIARKKTKPTEDPILQIRQYARNAVEKGQGESTKKEFGRISMQDLTCSINRAKDRGIGPDDPDGIQNRKLLIRLATEMERRQAEKLAKIGTGNTPEDVLARYRIELETAQVLGTPSEVEAWAEKIREQEKKALQWATQAKPVQTDLFQPWDYSSDMPLFRTDRGEPSPRGTVKPKRESPQKSRKKPVCTERSQPCKSTCISLKRECQDDNLSTKQERLRRLRRQFRTNAELREYIDRAKQSINRQTSPVREQRLEESRRRAWAKTRELAMGKVASGRPGSIGEMDPSEIEVDPKRFQYKVVQTNTSTGEVGSLSGVRRYDPNLGGLIQVWQDPADGKTYVVNGHNRLALAKRLGADQVAVRYLDVPDAKTARAVGALTNIAEGRGTAVDAAKFFRDSGLSKSDLDRKGIPMREKIATDGLALANLDDSIFRWVLDDRISVDRATRIGCCLGKPEDQRKLMEMIAKKESKGRRQMTNEAITELVDIIKSSTSKSDQQFDLFGASTVTQSLAMEKAELQAKIKRRLSRDKKLFGIVGKSKAAKQLAEAGNVIDVDKSQEVSQEAGVALSIFDRLKNQSGPLSSLLNEAAERISNGESPQKVEAEIYDILRKQITSFAGL